MSKPGNARKMARQMIEAVSGEGVASACSSFFATLGTAGLGAAVGTLTFPVMAPVLATLGVFGTTAWLRCRAEGKRDEAIDARFTDLGEVLGLVSQNVADTERKVEKLTAIIEALPAHCESIGAVALVEAVREAAVEASADLAVLGFDTNERLRGVADQVAAMLSQFEALHRKHDITHANQAITHANQAAASKDAARTHAMLGDLGETADRIEAILIRYRRVEPAAGACEPSEGIERYADAKGRALAAQDASALQSALAEAERWLESEMFDVLMLRADQYVLEGEYAKALPFYERALTLRPRDWTVLMKIGDTASRGAGGSHES